RSYFTRCASSSVLCNRSSACRIEVSRARSSTEALLMAGFLVQMLRFHREDNEYGKTRPTRLPRHRRDLPPLEPAHLRPATHRARKTPLPLRSRPLGALFEQRTTLVLRLRHQRKPARVQRPAELP